MTLYTRCRVIQEVKIYIVGLILYVMTNINRGDDRWKSVWIECYGLII